MLKVFRSITIVVKLTVVMKLEINTITINNNITV